MTPSPCWQRTSIFRLDAAARLILRDPDQAKDAVQETLVRAWRDLPTLRTADRFDAWLHRLLVRACIDEARRLRRHRVDIELFDRHAGHRRPRRRSVDRDELERGFDRLGPEERALIVLHYYLDLPLPEVAGALGIPLGTAKSRLHRALGLMRAALDAETRLRPELARGRPRMSARDDFDGFLSDWLDEGPGAARPTTPTRSWPARVRPASGRGGRASKGGSPCKRPSASRPCPGWA